MLEETYVPKITRLVQFSDIPPVFQIDLKRPQESDGQPRHLSISGILVLWESFHLRR